MSRNDLYYPPSDWEDDCPCEYPKSEGCCKTCHQYMDVSVPIEVKPNTMVGKAEIECCGDPTVCCKDSHGGNSCEITVTQRICLKLPIEYNLTACIGESEIDCADGDCCK